MQENNQAWSQPRQGYRPVTQRPPYAGMPQGTGGLTREERQEAKRLADEWSYD